MKMDMSAKPEGEEMPKTDEGIYDQEQMEEMLSVFKLALIDPSKISDLEFLSFNEIANVLMKWWVGSTMRVHEETRELEKKLMKLGTEIDIVMEQLGELSSEHENEIGIATYEYEGEKMDFKITQNPDGSIEIQLMDGPAENDPGDGISPFDS